MVPFVGSLSARELDALVEQATVDAYDIDEQLTGLYAVIGDELATPFQTVVLGVEVTVTGVDLVPGTGIVALCRRGAYKQRTGLLDLPLPSPPPTGAQWIDAYRRWA
jgi:hypothetical protein